MENIWERKKNNTILISFRESKPDLFLVISTENQALNSCGYLCPSRKEGGWNDQQWSTVSRVLNMRWYL